MARPQTKRQRLSPVKVTDISQDRTVIRLEEFCENKKTAYNQDVISSASLEELIAPLDERVFLEACFRRCAVHVPTIYGDMDRMKRIRERLFDLDPASILRCTSSESVFVWLRTGQDLIESIEVSDADTALALYKAGNSTYCRAPPDMEQWLVSSLLAGTGLGCGQYDPTCESMTCMGRGEVEVFISTPGHDKTDWHFDFQENFTLQLSGTKRWTVQKSRVCHPLRGCTPHYRSPESVEPQLKAAHLAHPKFQFGQPKSGVNALGEPEVVVVKPGDVLYFPAGMWHKVEVIEPGVSINISLMATNYATFTCQALQHLLLKRDEWRESVVSNSQVDAVDRLKSLLKELPDIIREFEQKGGADAILPQATRQVKTIAVEGNEEDDDGEQKGELIIDGNTHELPSYLSEMELRDRFRTHRLIRNPLASLLRQSEIDSFYMNDDDDAELESDMYVLNVNYAGNEGHESFQRVRIHETNGALLSSIYANSKDAMIECPLPASESWIDSEQERSMLNCLIYYGYLLWVAK